MADIRPILLSNPNIQHVAATRKTAAIGRWDIITDVENHESVKTEIMNNLTDWLLSASSDPEHPDDYPQPGIAARGTAERDTSSQGDVSYLSSSAGSYDSLMEDNVDEQYNFVPDQRKRNAISVSGFSWAQVAARAPASKTPSHVSELTNPTQATQSIAHQTEITALKTEVTEMRGQLKRFEDLIILLTSRLPPPAESQQQQQHPVQNQQIQPFQNQQQIQQWQQPFPYQPPRPYPPTPPRNNGRRQDPRGPPIHDDRARIEAAPPRKLPQDIRDSNLQERPSKKSDAKRTPARQGPAPPANLGDPNERQLVYNPYAQSRHPPPQQVVNEHHPSQYAHNQMDANGNYYDGRHDALIYSQPPGQFQYTPPSPERPEDQYNDPSRDTLMNERADSHSAEDARNYASL
jgi:hypothetical protein